MKANLFTKFLANIFDLLLLLLFKAEKSFNSLANKGA